MRCPLRPRCAEPEPSAPTKEQEEELLPALFWDGSEDWINEDNCADFAALQSLKYDDSTPEERAEELKRKGNDALKYKQNKLYVRKAVQQYTLALLETFEDAKLRAVIHGNRAHAALRARTPTTPASAPTNVLPLPDAYFPASYPI